MKKFILILLSLFMISSLFATYSETSTRITIDDEGNFTLQDVLDSGVSGIYKLGDRMYYTNKTFYITGDSYFYSADEVWHYYSPENTWLILSSTASFQLGLKDSNNNTYDGSTWIIRASGGTNSGWSTGTSSGDVRLYGSYITQYGSGFWRLYRGSSQVVEIQDVSFNGFVGGMRVQGTNSYMKNVDFSQASSSTSPFGTKSPFGSVENVKIRKSEQGFYWNSLDIYSGSVTIRGLEVNDVTYLMTVTGESTNTATLINPIYDTFNINWGATVITDNVSVKEYYSYNLAESDLDTQTPITGVRLYAEDKDGTVIFNNVSDESGNWDEILLQRAYYVKSNGNTPTLKTPHTMRIRKLGYTFLEQSRTSSSPVVETIGLITNNFITETNETTVSGYSSKINVNGTTKQITLTGTTTLEELYDYTQYWLTQSDNMIYSEMFTTTDGSIFSMASDWKLINGRYLDTTGTYKGGVIEYNVAGTYTPTFGNILIDFTSGGDYYFSSATFQGTLEVNSSNNSNVTLYLEAGQVVTNHNPTWITVDNSLIVDLVLTGTGDETLEGSRVQFYNTNSSTELLNEVAISNSVTTSITYTSDFPLRYRVMKANQTNGFEWVEGTATVTSSGMNVNVELKPFSAYDTSVSALDSQGVDYGVNETEMEINGSTLRVYITEIDNTIEYGYRIPVYYFYYLTTEDGIRNQDGGNVIWNSAEYAQFVKDGSNILKIKNQKSSPLIIRNINILPTSGGEEEIFDTSGGTIFINPPIVVPFEFASSSVTEGDKEDIASKVWDEATADHTDSSTFGGFIQSLKTFIFGLY